MAIGRWRISLTDVDGRREGTLLCLGGRLTRRSRSHRFWNAGGLRHRQVLCPSRQGDHDHDANDERQERTHPQDGATARISVVDSAIYRPPWNSAHCTRNRASLRCGRSLSCGAALRDASGGNGGRGSDLQRAALCPCRESNRVDSPIVPR